MFEAAPIVVAAVMLLKQQSISATAYGCDFSGARAVTIYAQNRSLFGDAGRLLTVPARITSSGTLEFQFSLPPGPFFIRYRAGGRGCSSGDEGITILPGHDRRIMVSMVQNSPMFVSAWHPGKFFAGTLPAAGLAVSVVVSDNAQCPSESAAERAAAIDDGAYYVANVYGKHAFLKLRSGAFDTLYIALPDTAVVDRDNEYVIRNITLDDLRILNTHPINDAVQCVSSPSGMATPFNM